MIQSVNKTDFHDAFRAYGRTDNYSYEALDILFGYFEEIEESTGEQIELDVIAICCEYCEDTFANIAQYYNIDISEFGDDDASIKEVLRDYLQDNTALIGETDKTFIYQGF